VRSRVPEPTPDHRRAIAERNVEAILDAAEELLEERGEATIATVAAEAGISGVTVYALTLEAAEPEVGPTTDALERIIAAG
jgi:AcrR family transcriptional regulator